MAVIKSNKSKLTERLVTSPSPLREGETRPLALNAVLYAASREAYIAAAKYTKNNAEFDGLSDAIKAMWCEIALAAILTHGAAPFKPIRTAPDNRDILIFLDGEWRKFSTTNGKKREWYSRDGYKISDDDARSLNLVWCELPGRPQNANSMIIQARPTDIKSTPHPTDGLDAFDDTEYHKKTSRLVDKIKKARKNKTGVIKLRG